MPLLRICGNFLVCLTGAADAFVFALSVFVGDFAALFFDQLAEDVAFESVDVPRLGTVFQTTFTMTLAVFGLLKMCRLLLNRFGALKKAACTFSGSPKGAWAAIVHLTSGLKVLPGYGLLINISLPLTIFFSRVFESSYKLQIIVKFTWIFLIKCCIRIVI